VIVLPATLLSRIATSAQEAYPEECCGLLIGFRDADQRVRVTEIVEAANVAPPPRRDRFEVDPAVRFATMRRLRGSTQDIVGHYHSHPDGPARPSAHDAEMVYEPELIWLIVAVAAGRAGEAAAFRYDPTMFAFRPLPILSTNLSEP
jgi:proteasome lid subunit RPN8/RPN11